MDLSHKRILITRPRRQADEFASALQAEGASSILFPVIEIGELEDTAELDRALSELSGYNWFILTSVNGVLAVWKRFEALHLPGIPGGVKVAAIGPKTAVALQSRGVQPDFVPKEYIAEAILPGLGDLRGQRALLARADLARHALAVAIQQAGGAAHEVAAYRTLPARPDLLGLAALREGVDVVTFTSSSTVKNFITLAKSAGLDPVHLPGVPILACIGPITAATAYECGLPVRLVAPEYTTGGLLEALKQF